MLTIKSVALKLNSDQVIEPFEAFLSTLFNHILNIHLNLSANFTYFSDCKREIHDLRGAIESPNFPANYPHYSSCEWKIVPPMGNRVYLEFSHFDLEHTWSIDDDTNTKSANCMFDHLTIEEHDTTDTIIRSDKYCASMPKPLNTSHTLVLKFVLS